MLKDPLAARQKGARDRRTVPAAVAGADNVDVDTPDFEGPHAPHRQAGGETLDLAELMGEMVHEMQNCLQGISMGLDLLSLTQTDSLENRTILRSVERLSRLLREMREYFAPPETRLAEGDVGPVLEEVARQVAKEWSPQATRLRITYRDPLPPLRLDWRQFRTTLGRVLTFSFAALPSTKGVEIEAGLRDGAGQQYVELTVIGPCVTLVGDKDVFHPLLRINNYQTGLSLLLARQMLQRHDGELSFHHDHRRQQGVFTFLLRVH